MDRPVYNEQERGGCLTVFLVLSFIGSLLGLVGTVMLSSGSNALAGTGYNFVLPSWYLPVAVISIVVHLVAIYGVWTWKKWGVYLLIAEYVFSFFITLSTNGIAYALGGMVVSGLILWYLLKDKMEAFE
jgi:hypothetical protein